MSRLFGLAALVLFMVLMIYLPQRAIEGAPLSMLLGFLLLSAFLFGKIGNFFGLPGITGYLLAGIILGPSCFGVLDKSSVKSLALINSFALTLIGLNAGGEVHLKRIRERFSSLALITASQVLLGFLGMLALMTLLVGYFPGSLVLSLPGQIAIASLFAVIALANSPSSTVAVIVETGARGRMSELILGITIIKDIVVILGFALAISMSGSILGSGMESGQFHLAELSWEIGGSILFGVLIGLGIISYMVYVNVEIPIFIIALGFVITKLSNLLDLHAMLVCMVAGLVINNLSDKGKTFIQAIEKGSIPLFVIFFAIAGAEIDFTILSQTWYLMLALVASRLFFTWISTLIGAVIAREEPGTRNNIWMGFVAQAGVSLGMVVIVAETFPEWGGTFKNIVVGSIAVFQLIGPVLFKVALARAGEISSTGRG
jgi:Kef-type K+ transport system membrane component KefB